MTNTSEPDNNLLLCLDLEKGSRQLVEHAAQLAGRCDLATCILHVSRTLPDAVRQKKILLQLHNLVDRPFADLSIAAMEIETGVIEDIIIKIARRHHVNIILLGRRQRSRIERIHVGSTTRAVITLATQPVLVVPVDQKTERDI